ncbi:hypothetical protein ABDK00_010130 [Niabella insulamsoli]|uniref:hypothetical protein n=1 Tax=Niabella insulamsoli TaxID=3144874 RepID=UPI0031FD0399
MPRTLFLFLTLLTGLVNGLRAQTKPLPPVTIAVDSMPVMAILPELEKQSGYYFYFDSTDVDSAYTDLTANNERLDLVLNRMLVPYALTFTVDPFVKRIYIAKALTIRTSLPPSLYGEKSSLVRERKEDMPLILASLRRGKKRLRLPAIYMK